MGFREPIDVRNFRDFERKIRRFCKQFETDSGSEVEVVYRGLADGLRLTTTLERTIELWDVPNTIDPVQVERDLIREFRRGYYGQDAEQVRHHTCYCLALMQHHGSPTRMLDWTYSPYIAAKFALDKRKPRSNNDGRTYGVVWCLNANWLRNVAAEVVGNMLLDRWDAERRAGEPSEELFRTLFMSNHSQKKFVLAANPFVLNERLKVQQGLFLCQGDVTQSFVHNLECLQGYEENILRIRLVLNGSDLSGFAQSLWRMNISSASLFPGLDGYAKSLGERIFTFGDAH